MGRKFGNLGRRGAAIATTPKYLNDWATWAIVTRKLKIPMVRPKSAPANIPDKYLWVPAWVWWRMNGRKGPRPKGVPAIIPKNILDLYTPIALHVRAIQATYRPIPPPVPPSPVVAPGAAIWREPGLLTDANGARDANWLVNHGFKWIVGQAQNDWQVKSVGLQQFKNAGMKVGVWGVVYDRDNFRQQGQMLANLAREMSADLLVIDAEECLKNADPTPLIEGLSEFSGDKALTTLGAAVEPWVFPIRYDLFLAAGYDILAQAYVNAAPEYEPYLCVDHAVRAGIPLHRHQLMVDFSSEGMGHIDGATWAQKILRARQESINHGYDPGTHNVSVFMSEFGSEQDYNDFQAGLNL